VTSTKLLAKFGDLAKKNTAFYPPRVFVFLTKRETRKAEKLFFSNRFVRGEEYFVNCQSIIRL
jgi:hypothetical protein